MAGNDDLYDQLASRLDGETGARRRLLLVALLDRALGDAGRVVLVGGGAVEAYTNGAYTTADTDLLAPRAALAPLLERAGFTRRGRYYVLAEPQVLLEIPGEGLEADQDVLVLDVDGLQAPVLSPEDLIADRLAAAKFWGSMTDWEQAVLLRIALQDVLRLDALRAKAEREEVEDLLPELEETAFG